MKNNPNQSNHPNQSGETHQGNNSNQHGNHEHHGHHHHEHESEQIFYNGNIAGVQNGPTHPTVFSLNRERFITKLTNYHYFNHGTAPGTIWIVHTDGTTYGPWKTTGSVGQGGVKDAYWNCNPNIWIKAGTYTVFDSHPSTWSHNSQSNFEGFTWIEAMK